MTAPPPALSILPATLGRYEIQSELGRGAMGVVYKAADPVLGRSVALKVIRAAFPVGRAEQKILEQRFLREATLAAALSHPNIVVVHDVGWDPQSRTPFIALEYLEGRTLSAIMAHGESLDWRAAARMTARLADALHHAHAHGIVHRDIKPSNIMILSCGRAKILDFGVAKDASTPLTTPGELWGTPFYMSPEQASGSRVDGRSDLFALGSVLYELVTGRRAFGGEGVAKVIHRLLYERPPRPTRLNAALPPAMDAVVARALAKDVDQRYPDGRSFAEDLEDVLQSRALRVRGLAVPSDDDAAVESGPRRTLLDPSPPTLTTRPHRAMRLPRLSRAARTGRAITLGATLGIGAVAIALAASTGTGQTSSTFAAAAIAPAALAPPAVRAPASLLAPAAPQGSSRPAEKARVAIALSHSLKEGRVKVWVDEKIVLDQPLTPAAETHSVLFFKKRKGLFTEVLQVAPGERTMRFEVDGGGETRRALVSGRLRRDQTRLLAVKVGNKLRLEWKS